MTDRPEMYEGVDTIWMDGDFVDFEDAEIHVLTHGLHYGTGVFEGARCYDTVDGPAIFRWEEHLERLYDSAKPYDIDIPFDPEEITEATMELIDREGLQSCYIRPIAFYGYGPLGLNPANSPVKVARRRWPPSPASSPGSARAGRSRRRRSGGYNTTAAPRGR